MSLSNFKKAVALTGLTVVMSGISGCTASMFEIGEEPTVCPEALEGGITCTSAREIWKLSDNPEKLEAARIKSKKQRDEDYDEYDDYEHDYDHDHDTTAAVTQYPGGTPAERQAIYLDHLKNNSKLAAPEPIAVRQEAKVLRVLMNSWEDDSERLHMPGYTYVEIEKRKWIVGRGATTNTARITPLSIRKNSLEEERKNNPVGDNGMGIIQSIPTPNSKTK